MCVALSGGEFFLGVTPRCLWRVFEALYCFLVSLPGLEEDLASGATGAGPRKDLLMKLRVSPNALPALPRLLLRW